MSRSVSTHPNAVATVYLHPGLDSEHEGEQAWADFLEEVTGILQRRFKSLRPASRWVDRENHVVLQNDYAEVTVSEYCGLVSVCLAPIHDPYRDPSPLATNWLAQVGTSFEHWLQHCFAECALVSQGRASNGEQFFTRLGKPGTCVTPKEGQLW